jgi:hypothetical protein
MDRCDTQSKRHRFVSFVEVLDDRLVLSALGPVPASPAPTAGPFSVAHVRQLERDLEQVDHGVMAKSKHLKSSVVVGADRLKTELAKLAAREPVQVQQVSVTSNMSTAAGETTRAQSPKDQVDQLVASFNTPSTQGNDGFGEDFGILTAASAASNFRPGVPASAIESNFQDARAGLINAVKSPASNLQTQATALTSRVSGVSSASASASATTKATAAPTTTTGTGTISTQVFSNLYTQASSPIDAAINSVDATSQQVFGLLQTQLSNNVTSAIRTFSSAPAGTFQPTVGFATGNGVTFSSP